MLVFHGTPFDMHLAEPLTIFWVPCHGAILSPLLPLRWRYKASHFKGRFREASFETTSHPKDLKSGKMPLRAGVVSRNIQRKPSSIQVRTICNKWWFVPLLHHIFNSFPTFITSTDSGALVVGGVSDICSIYPSIQYLPIFSVGPIQNFTFWTTSPKLL